MMSNPKFFYDNLVGSSDLVRSYLFVAIIEIKGMSPSEFFIRSATLPSETVEPIVVPRMNSEVKFAGKVKYNDWTVEVIDTIEMDNYAIFRAYQKMIYDASTGKVDKKSNYTGNAVIKIMNSTIDPISDFILSNLWITNLEPPQLQHGSTDLYKFKATFKYDFFDWF